jgi:hypothetical protein
MFLKCKNVAERLFTVETAFSDERIFFYLLKRLFSPFVDKHFLLVKKEKKKKSPLKNQNFCTF